MKCYRSCKLQRTKKKHFKRHCFQKTYVSFDVLRVDESLYNVEGCGGGFVNLSKIARMITPRYHKMIDHISRKSLSFPLSSINSNI